LRGFFFAAVVVVALFSASTALGAERPWSIAALGNWGGASTQAVAGDESAARRYGLGIRAGYTFPVRLHLGALVSTTRGGMVGADLTQRIECGGEIGWDIPIGIALLRPLAGGGAVVAGGRAAPSVWPGIAFVGNVPGSPLFVGLDARLFFPTTRPATPTTFIVAGARI
jgi:hypothetical protein